MKETLDQLQQTLTNIISEGDYDRDPCADDIHKIEALLNGLNENDLSRAIAGHILGM